MENKPLKILVVGDWLAEIYEQAIFDAFTTLGHHTYRFSWIEYFKYYPYGKRFKTDNNILKSIYYRFQNKYSFGPALLKINYDLIKYCKSIRPDLIFVYRGGHIYPSTIKDIKRLGATVFVYHNDDVFSNYYPWYTWRHFKDSLPFYDHIFAYRQKNIEDCKKLRIFNVSMLKPYYIKKNNFHIEHVTENQYTSDVSFIGHFENDSRDEYIKEIIERGYKFKLLGTGWKKSQYYDFFIDKFGAIQPVYSDYNLALNSTKISLVFLSKINNDTYTRRCLEIPATKTLMLSEYTDDLNRMFEENKEAVYFRNKQDLLGKIEYYLNNEDERLKISEAGYKRLISSNYDSIARAKEILNIYYNGI